MHYTIYKITNIINEKIYIGKHQTLDLNDGYLGSGTLLTSAKNKHGTDNFKKEILHVFDTEDEMNLKEYELVTEEFCRRADTYNLAVGGRGGFKHINNNEFLRKEKNSRARKSADRVIMEKYGVSNSSQIPGIGEKISRSLKAAYASGKKVKNTCPMPNNWGRKHTAETVAKMSIARKGSGNSQFGKMWITDGQSSKTIQKDNSIPVGWRKGRVL